MFFVILARALHKFRKLTKRQADDVELYSDALIFGPGIRRIVRVGLKLLILCGLSVAVFAPASYASFVGYAGGVPKFWAIYFTVCGLLFTLLHYDEDGEAFWIGLGLLSALRNSLARAFRYFE